MAEVRSLIGRWISVGLHKVIHECVCSHISEDVCGRIKSNEERVKRKYRERMNYLIIVIR